MAENKTNPFIEIPEVILYPGEVMLPLNPYTNKGYMIRPVYYVTNFGRYFSIATGRLEEKSLIPVSGNYLELQVATDQGQKHVAAHRGVLATFYPRPDMYNLEVDHINGDKTNNRIDNLRWVTGKENVIYAVENGLTSPRMRYSSDDYIIRIMELAKNGYSDEEISQIIYKDVDLAPETIRFIRTGQNIYGDILKRLGLEPIILREHTHLTKDDYDKIADLFESGKSAKEISDITGIKYRTVRGIIFRTFGNAQERSNPNSLTRKDPSESGIRKSNPLITIPQKYIDEGIEIYPINIHTSPSHTIKPWYGVTKDGRMFSMARGNEWQEMNLGISHHGYSTVGLTTDHGMKQFMVHRIVLATFKPKDDMYDLEVDHINGVKTDNNINNLDWVSHTENMRRAADTGLTLHKVSQRAPDEDIIRINELAWSGHSDEEISKIMDYKYSASNVKVIRSGLKTYMPVLEQLGLKPFRYQKREVNDQDRKEIYNYISSRLGTKGLMELYEEAANLYEIDSSTVRRIYSKEKNK